MSRSVSVIVLLLVLRCGVGAVVIRFKSVLVSAVMSITFQFYVTEGDALWRSVAEKRQRALVTIEVDAHLKGTSWSLRYGRV